MVIFDIFDPEDSLIIKFIELNTAQAKRGLTSYNYYAFITAHLEYTDPRTNKIREKTIFLRDKIFLTKGEKGISKTIDVTVRIRADELNYTFNKNLPEGTIIHNGSLGIFFGQTGLTQAKVRGAMFFKAHTLIQLAIAGNTIEAQICDNGVAPLGKKPSFASARMTLQIQSDLPEGVKLLLDREIEKLKKEIERLEKEYKQKGQRRNQGFEGDV